MADWWKAQAAYNWWIQILWKSRAPEFLTFLVHRRRSASPSTLWSIGGTCQSKCARHSRHVHGWGNDQLHWLQWPESPPYLINTRGLRQNFCSRPRPPHLWWEAARVEARNWMPQSFFCCCTHVFNVSWRLFWTTLCTPPFLQQIFVRCSLKTIFHCMLAARFLNTSFLKHLSNFCLFLEHVSSNRVLELLSWAHFLNILLGHLSWAPASLQPISFSNGLGYWCSRYYQVDSIQIYSSHSDPERLI